jgi:hypothetical protein
MSRSILVFVISCILFTFFESKSDGQIWKMRRYELIGGVGPSLFFGDIGGYSNSENILGFKDISLSNMRFNVNASMRYRLTRDLNVRLSMTYAMFHATDEGGSNEERQMEATINIFEPALIMEYFFIKNKAENSYLFSRGRGTFNGLIKSLDFYAFTGLAGVKYFVDRNEELAAKGMDPSGFSGAVPIGLGTSLIYSPDLNFGLEFGWRYSFTDSLDNLTSQYSDSNDVYYFLNFTVTYKLKTGKNGLPSFRK